MRISYKDALQLLKNGEVVAIPTETVYGLGANVSTTSAIEKIYLLKKRPTNNPLIIHVNNKESVYQYLSYTPPYFEELADAFWPGPLTLVLPIKENLIPAIARSNLKTAAFRIPKHQLTLQILENIHLVAPSANLSGKPSATRPEHIENDFGNDFPVLDGGATSCGVESTILIFEEDQWSIGRVGAISPSELSRILGYQPLLRDKISTKAPLCPGSSFRHYAPNARLIINSSKYSGELFVLGFSDRYYHGAKEVFSLGKSTDGYEVASNLYHIFREIDLKKISEVWVDLEIPSDDIWQTVRERILTAALS